MVNFGIDSADVAQERTCRLLQAKGESNEEQQIEL